MATITLKNVPAELYAQLKESAGVNHRSINREIIACIEQAVGSRRIDPEVALARARQLREKWRGPTITDDQFTEAKRAGRVRRGVSHRVQSPRGRGG
jgi:plasmid stability protein